MKLLSIIAFSKVFAQVNINSEKNVNDAMKKMVDNLMSYYVIGSTAYKGSINPNTSPGPDGFQWYEGGIMWGAVMEYMRLTGDSKYAETISNALVLASEGPVASFLGKIPTLAETLEGKWNDDILWWALPAVIGGEVFGKDAPMPGGTTYLNLANVTYSQVFAQWDSNTCGGGIYWSRDRNNAKSKGYKSTITHGQEMMLGARLAILTRNSKYLQDADQMYKFLKSSGIITADNRVLDGVDAEKGCAVAPFQLSYKVGFTIGALAWMFKASGNVEYINEANKLSGVALRTFTKNGVVTDGCEPSCPENQVSPKGAFLRGIGFLYEFTTDQGVKDNIKTVLQNSVAAMLNTCDADLNCSNYWGQGTPQAPNVHYQMNSVELMTAYAKTFKTGEIGSKIKAPTNAPNASEGNNQGNGMAIESGISAIVASLLIQLLF